MYLYKFVFLSSLFVFGFTNIALAASENITQINFTTAPQTIDINTISATISTQTQNAGGTLEQTSQTNHLNFSSTSPTGEFSSSSTNWIPISTVTMSTGTANKNFFYRDSTAGIHTLTVSATGQVWTGASQSITIVGAPIVLDSIAISTPASKLSYIVGDTLDIGGLVVTGTYSDNSTQIESVGTGDISGFDSSVAVSGQILTITVGGKTTTYTIDIVAPVVEVVSSRKYGSIVGFTSNSTGIVVPTPAVGIASPEDLKDIDNEVVENKDIVKNEVAIVKRKVTVIDKGETIKIPEFKVAENNSNLKASAVDSVSGLNIWENIKLFFKSIFQ